MKNRNKLGKIINFIPSFVRAMKSKDTPFLAKVLGFGAIVYAIMPADIIADFIPVLGILDDAIVLPFLLYLASTMMKLDNFEMKKAKVKKEDVIYVKDYEVK